MSETTPILIDERTAAKRLSLSPSALARLRKKGGVPHTRLGHLVRYDPDALAAWAKGKVEGRRQDEPISAR